MTSHTSADHRLMRLAAILAFAAPLLVPALASAAPPYRRPGLVGVYTDRHLTLPMNSISLLAGPSSPQTFGARLGSRNIEAGGEFKRIQVDGTGAAVSSEWWSRAGVAFGLLEDVEAGALFLNFQYTPTFDFSNIYVYITRGWRLGDVDLGVRLSFQTPGGADWSFNPGVPFNYRLGPTRLEAGVFLPFAVGDTWAGFNAPVRFAVNITPRIFTSIESGIQIPRFDETERTSVPLAFNLGYSLLFGANVIDLVGAFTFDDFAFIDAPAGVDTLQTSSHRITFGLIAHKMAVGPPK